MPQDRKPRQVVEDLRVGLPAITPQATPQDAYVRPGVSEVQRPEKTNPMLKLAESLSQIQSDLKPAFAKVQEQYTEKEFADAETAFYANRDKANEMIRSGEFPAGSSPRLLSMVATRPTEILPKTAWATVGRTAPARFSW